MVRGTNGIGWFEISTSDVPAAERFYGELFGWTFNSDGADDYRFITTPVEDGLPGGIADNGGTGPGYAIFYVVVEDVAATCGRAEAAGGKVVVQPQEMPGGLVLAHLHDPAGNLFAVFRPPAGAAV
ncbi:MAG TPA: VOC family protein [Micromonosporaceae bacterium]|nr:VOC family protein [Micromonosporaceae bacterium]